MIGIVPIHLSVVIPAYNEAQRLPGFLANASSYLAKRYGDACEILVVDDGSTDKTAQTVISLLGEKSLLRHPQNLGKGAAVRTGMLASRGHLRLFSDADGATPMHEETRLMEAISAGADIAIGSRAVRGGRRVFLYGKTKAAMTGWGHDRNNLSWHVYPHRHITGRIFAVLVQMMLSLPYGDTQCGFKMFTKKAAERVFSVAKVSNFAFDIEVLCLARLLELKVTEVAVSWHEVAGSKLHLLRDSWWMFQTLRRLRQMRRAVE